MKIAVTGHKGRLGSELIRNGCIPFDCDITNKADIVQAIFDIKPDIIINTASKTNVDGCESDPICTYKINTFGVENLALFTGKIVQISTDFIFDGQTGNYTERSIPNPISTYGISKRMGEVALETKHRNHIIIRTTILYDIYSDNFVTSVLKRLQNGELVKVSNDLKGNPTYIPHLAMAINKLLEKNFSGIINITGKDIVSRYDLAKEIAFIFGLEHTLVVKGPIMGEAKRPLNAGLNTQLAERIGLPIFSLQDGLSSFKRDYENQRNRS